jgi:hypothetical protein
LTAAKATARAASRSTGSFMLVVSLEARPVSLTRCVSLKQDGAATCYVLSRLHDDIGRN